MARKKPGQEREKTYGFIRSIDNRSSNNIFDISTVFILHWLPRKKRTAPEKREKSFLN